jgi:hypothetical protein
MGGVHEGPKPYINMAEKRLKPSRLRRDPQLLVENQDGRVENPRCPCPGLLSNAGAIANALTASPR